MPFTIEQQGRFLNVRWFGPLVREDLGRVFQELPRWSEDLGFAPDVLHSFEAVESIGFVFEDVIKHSRGRVWTPLPNPVKSAAVGHTPLTQGVARMFQSLNSNPMIQMEVFDSQAEALRWLATPTRE